MRLHLLTAMAVLAAGTAVLAHDWYPPSCCSGGDCAPLASERVSTTMGGYLIDGRYFIPNAAARDSMDGRYHACFPSPDKLQCFFKPPQGS